MPRSPFPFRRLILGLLALYAVYLKHPELEPYIFLVLMGMSAGLGIRMIWREREEDGQEAQGEIRGRNRR
jgi:hypothetical protein